MSQNGKSSNSNGGSAAHAWSDLPSQLTGAVGQLTQLLQKDKQFMAFCTTNAMTKDVTFGIKAAGTDNTILITVGNGIVKAGSASNYDKASFTLCALPEQWEEFFKQTPVMPYQSYW